MSELREFGCSPIVVKDCPFDGFCEQLPQRTRTFWWFLPLSSTLRTGPACAVIDIRFVNDRFAD